MSNLLQNKVAVVTGAASGIGRAVAIDYARHGAKVVVSDVNEAGGNKTVELIQAAGGEAFFHAADSSQPDDNKALVDAAVQRYGGLHIACNNAGIGGAEANVGDYPVKEWDKIIAINLSGVFYGMHYQLPAILQAGGGAIVNMASILGQVAMAGHSGYVAAKHGVVGLTRAAALEYSARNVRINAVGPGFIETPILDNLTDEVRQGLVSLHPIGRLGQPEEVAALVTWLSSEQASFVTGAYYPIDGGYLAR